jgi:hypothetical protein
VLLKSDNKKSEIKKSKVLQEVLFHIRAPRQDKNKKNHAAVRNKSSCLCRSLLSIALATPTTTITGSHNIFILIRFWRRRRRSRGEIAA